MQSCIKLNRHRLMKLLLNCEKWYHHQHKMSAFGEFWLAFGISTFPTGDRHVWACIFTVISLLSQRGYKKVVVGGCCREVPESVSRRVAVSMLEQAAQQHVARCPARPRRRHSIHGNLLRKTYAVSLRRLTASTGSTVETAAQNALGPISSEWQRSSPV